GVGWVVDVKSAGQYEVRLSYGCPAGDAGGSFEATCPPLPPGEGPGEGTKLAQATPIMGKTQPTAGKTIFQERVVGTMELPAGQGLFTVAALEIPGEELMTLHKVWLRRLDN